MIPPNSIFIMGAEKERFPEFRFMGEEGNGDKTLVESRTGRRFLLRRVKVDTSEQNNFREEADWWTKHLLKNVISPK
jgi:hypothetical protein